MKEQKTNAIVLLYHKLGSPPSFYRISGYFLKWLLLIAVILAGFGMYDGLVISPIDYQQFDSVRIMYVHVPAAWMSMFIYGIMGVSAIIAIIWRMKIAEAILLASAPIGAWFTFIALVTGSLWGKPMWGTWWEWDARMTSELILLFLYIGIMATHSAFAENSRKAARMAALIAVVGLVNLPIIHFSVKWWSSIHQGTTVSLLGESKMGWDMLRPLLTMAFAANFYCGYSMLKTERIYLLETEQQKKWVQNLIASENIS